MNFTKVNDNDLSRNDLMYLILSVGYNQCKEIIGN